MGSEDPSPEARAGLATGLRDIFFDGFETLILDWYDDEDSEGVKQRLLEHMARNAGRSPAYMQAARALITFRKPVLICQDTGEGYAVGGASRRLA